MENTTKLPLFKMISIRENLIILVIRFYLEFLKIYYLMNGAGLSLRFVFEKLLLTLNRIRAHFIRMITPDWR